MSEHEGTLRARRGAVPPSSRDDDSAARSIGEYLKRQRVMRGIAIEDLAASTRIPLRSLERLEAGYFDGVSDGFVRGFVRTVALALGLDADQTVARMLDEPVGSKWDAGTAGLWRKQALALVALVAATAIAFFALRAGWSLLVGSGGAGAGREVVVWRDPVHRLARDLAEGRYVPPAPPVETIEPPAGTAIAADAMDPVQPGIEPDAAPSAEPAVERGPGPVDEGVAIATGAEPAEQAGRAAPEPVDSIPPPTPAPPPPVPAATRPADPADAQP